MACSQKQNVLLIGGGGREHTICWKLSSSDIVERIYISPGNAGTSNEPRSENVNIDVSSHTSVIEFCKLKKIGIVIVAPEVPLADGIANSLLQADIPCFGPSRLAAEIESSKEFSKDFMKRHNIPTARFESFTDSSEASEFIRNSDYNGYVVKASGLAAGKGVVVAEDKDEAINAVNEMINVRQFGDAGATVIIEEKLEGEEVSILAFSDGKTVAAFPPARDFKRLLNGNKGPNTGGMGAYCPAFDLCSHNLWEDITENVLKKTITALDEEDRKFVGILYAGMMLTSSGPMVLEFNCRFGDPETQVLLPLLSSDLMSIILDCTNGNLNPTSLAFKENHFAVTVVMTSGGYPLSYGKGFPILGVEEVQKSCDTAKVIHAGTQMKNNELVTSGGRVLAVTALGSSVHNARKKSYEAISHITFKDAFYRSDIALTKQNQEVIQIKTTYSNQHSMSYADAGVNIAAGASLIDALKPLAKSTRRPGCTPNLGGFGGLFDLSDAGYGDTVLVSGADGVGTKLKIAQDCGKHSTVGIDLVAMCVNDILAQGAEPLFFLDYYACGKLDVAVAEKVVCGIAKGCRLAGCALVGGETAEMPGFYTSNEYDLAGFAVGAVSKTNILPRCEDISEGDVVIGLASSGLHSNGFSLVRAILKREHIDIKNAQCPYLTDEKKSFADDLLTPTRIYIKSVLPLLQKGLVKAFAHITGGGLIENIPRVLPPSLGVSIDASSWHWHPIYSWLANKGNIPPTEMASTFNCGIGAVLIVNKSDSNEVMKSLSEIGETSFVIGHVNQTSNPQVEIKNLQDVIKAGQAQLIDCDTTKQLVKKRVAVMISGSGTNLQALIDASLNRDSPTEISLVISNVADVKGLERASKAKIPTMVINHKNYKNRIAFDMAVNECLKSHGIQYVCLAGFMRILTGEFVRLWQGKLINIHPSLLPSFKGLHVHEQVLDAGVRFSGCTVHFVVEDIDAGGIIAQEVVPVLIDDTTESLQERVKSAEHKAYPKALEILCSGQVSMAEDGKTRWTKNIL